MSDETIYKAQQKAALSSESSRTAMGLIVGGIALLVLTLSGADILELVAPLIFISGFGTLLMMPAHRATAENPSRWRFLAAPGGLFLTLGVLIFAMGIVDHFEAFAYAWTFLPMGVLMGLMYAHRFDETHQIHENGRKAIRVLLIICVTMGAFFELLVFETLGPWWPVVLIGYGAYLLSRKRSTS